MQPIGKLRFLAGLVALILAAAGVILTVQKVSAQDSGQPTPKQVDSKGQINPALGF